MKSNIHVLYLQFEPKIDHRFIYLSRVFNQFGMTLVPITLKEFKSLKIGSHEYVVSLVRDIRSVKVYRPFLKRYLNYFLRMKKITLFEFSSFETIHEPSLLKSGAVNQVRLPVSMFQVVESIGTKIYHDKTSGSKKWPGGKRVKLPVG